MPGTFKWLVVAILLTGAGPTAAQKSPDARVSDLVQAGKIRIGLFSSNLARTPPAANCEVSDRTWLGHLRRE